MIRSDCHAVGAYEAMGGLRGSKQGCLRSSSCSIVKLRVHDKRAADVVKAIHRCSFDLDQLILLGFLRSVHLGRLSSFSQPMATSASSCQLEKSR